MGTQTDDTPLASNGTLTATVDDIMEQILGKQEGVRQILQATHGTRRGSRDKQGVRIQTEGEGQGKSTQAHTHQRTQRSNTATTEIRSLNHVTEPEESTVRRP